MNTHEPNSNHEASDSFTQQLRESLAGQTLPPADPALREAILKKLAQPAVSPALSVAEAQRRRSFFQRAGIALVSTAALALAAVIWQRPDLSEVSWSDAPAAAKVAQTTPPTDSPFGNQAPRAQGLGRGRGAGERPEEEVERLPADSRSMRLPEINSPQPVELETQSTTIVPARSLAEGLVVESTTQTFPSPQPASAEPSPAVAGRPEIAVVTAGTEAAGRPSGTPGPGYGAMPKPQPTAPSEYKLAQGEPADRYYRETGEENLNSLHPKTIDELRLTQERLQSSEKKLATGQPGIEAKAPEGDEVAQRNLLLRQKEAKELKDEKTQSFYFAFPLDRGGEQYARIIENQFLNPRIKEQALSTFSIDVDKASYANVRRFLTNGQLPPPDAVRLEELVNYFKYKYPQPKGSDPFSVNLEMADCPWQPGHKLVRVGLQGKEIHRAERPASNLVFLIDTSGSMTDQNKLPLLKQAFTMLVGELGENDKVTIVTYAGNAGLRLPPTRGHEKERIIAAIDGMQSGGSTHGSAGIALAYEIAAAQFIKDGTNKVILATDGDLNVGITDDAALVELITKKAESGVFLTVLGVGTGNLKDAKMERLADNGNGIYAYLDSVREARKVLVEEMSGSLVTIAKDVKIQVEFNPAHVQSYRLLGYENRVMANQDFRNDAKDAGEIGAGHSVTALYEVALVGAPELKGASGEPLRYQRVPEATPKLVLTDAGKSGELLTVRLRYKQPEMKKDDKAKEVEYPLLDKGGSFNSASKEFQFASAVVAFGLALRQSEYRGSANFSAVAEIATATTGEDVGGHRAEFLDLVRRAKALRGE